MASHKEVLNFAKKLKSKNPNLTRNEMKGLLEAHFVKGYSSDVVLSGAVANPMDFLEGLGTILKGLIHIFNGDNKGIRDIIEGVLIILYER